MKILIAIWLACAPVTYGATFGYFQNKYPESANKDCRKDLGMAVFMITGGPISLFIVTTFSGFYEYGFKWRC